jgi:tripartite-type tricarboxylate transporter receptor subunit TctC
MTVPIARRAFLNLMTTGVALAALSHLAQAEDYPTRPVRIVVAQAAGSGSDTGARLMAQWLSARLHQQFVVENRPGAGGNIGTEEVVHAPADGYTILLMASANTVNATLYKSLSFNIIRDIAPVAGIFIVPQILEVNPTFPAKTVPQFIAYAKANPGKITLASSGIGSAQHVAGELFQYMTGIKMVHVPYRGTTPALTDLLAGRVDVMFDVTPTSLPHIKAGKLRALAVTTATRIESLPDVPVVAEFVPGYEASAWLGFGVPTGTPQPIVDLLNREVNAGLADPTIKALFAALGATVLPGTAADFKKRIADDTAKWAKVIKFADIKPE